MYTNVKWTEKWKSQKVVADVAATGHRRAQKLCPHWRLAEFGNSRRVWRQSPFSVTVAKFGDYIRQCGQGLKLLNSGRRRRPSFNRFGARKYGTGIWTYTVQSIETNKWAVETTPIGLKAGRHNTAVLLREPRVTHCWRVSSSLHITDVYCFQR